MNKKKTAKHGSKKKGDSKKPIQAKPVSAFPTDWFFLHKEPYTPQQLKEIFLTFPGLDVEVWPDLRVLELTFPNKIVVDFEGAEPDFPDEAGAALLAEHQVATCYLVTVEPTCNQPELDFLQQVAQRTGGFFAADTDDLTPRVMG